MNTYVDQWCVIICTGTYVCRENWDINSQVITVIYVLQQLYTYSLIMRLHTFLSFFLSLAGIISVTA